VVVLTERDGDGELPIWVGPFEATALALSLQATEMPRPMTYQFTSNLVSATGGRVVEVRITGLTEGVFYATVVVEGPASVGEVDARPSDALNLALVTGSPIRVDRRLLEEPDATKRTEWRGYPTATAAIVAEVHHQHERDVADAAAACRADTADSPQTNL
jgi:bifunctional DNase/RNase